MRAMFRPLALATALAIASAAFATRPAAAQLSPDADWRTVRTEHFRIHFVPELELLARRAAVSAETAWVQLAAELVPPRGTVDIVISDDADFSNGWATPFPTNRIVIYAHPPTEGQTLRFYHDWMTLVITHELAHIFHLDRTRGWWRVAQWVFGRNPFLFPNQFQPRWVTEGLAVYYESQLTGYGRLAGTEHRTLAEASRLADRIPRLDELSLATPRFPGGQAAYAYGSLLFDHLGETRGPATVAEFVERSSGATIPFLLNRTARRSFGISLSDAWREWSDSLRAQSREIGPPLPDWRELTREGRYAQHPRWLDDSTIVYTASTGRESPGLYGVTVRGGARRLARRNALDANVPLAAGGVLFSQPEYVSPYVVRSDLYIERDGQTRRLTEGARVAFPDARRDGHIVAVRAGLGTTHLVRISPEGRVTALTTAHPDTQWSAPRWSPDGARIVTIRWRRGAVSELVILDTLGAVGRVLARERAVLGTPTWTRDGSGIVYTSDRGGATDLYLVPVDAGAGEPAVEARRLPMIAPGTRRLSDAHTALVEPDLAPRADTVAAAYFRADGYHIGIGAVPSGPVASAAPGAASGSVAGGVAPVEGAARDSIVRDSAARDSVARGVIGRDSVARDTTFRAGTLSGADSIPAEIAPAALHEGPITRYSPWRSLVPRYWLPTIIEIGETRVLVGALTGASDLVERHSYTLQGTVGSDGEYSAELGWRYAGLGQPVLDVGFSRFQDPPFLFQTGDQVGEYSQAEDRAAVTVGVSRPRYRSNAFAQIGAEIQRFTARTDPPPLLDVLGIPETSWRNGIFVSTGWSNTQRPALAISPEDGASVSGYALRRWSTGELGRASTTLLAIASAYKSLDLPGFAHHVIALRGAAAYTDQNTFSRFSIGGTSGSTAALVPGVLLGDPRRRFGVRGFPVVDSVEVDGRMVVWRGIRALGWTAEYRAPLFLAARGYRLLPLFFDRTSFTLFTEGAAVWCPAPSGGSGACPEGGIPRQWLASAGAEVSLDAALLTYDFPYRFRVGVAMPYQGRRYAESDATVYVTLGLGF